MSGTRGINTHGIRLSFGKHNGELITRVPVSYLRWMVCNGTDQAAEATAELERRGTTLPDVDVSGHALDRASLNCQPRWRETARKNEGLYAWLARLAGEALGQGERMESGKIKYEGLKFAFEEDGAWPVLKTVMPCKRAPK